MRTRTYVFWEPFGPRDYAVFADDAQGYRYQQGLVRQGKASQVVVATLSRDELNAEIRRTRQQYVERLVARTQAAS